MLWCCCLWPIQQKPCAKQNLRFYSSLETTAVADAHLTTSNVGGQLWERVEAGRFSEAQAARIIREILQLLAQAHSRNIIIRDIKPDNLLFLDHSDDSPLKAIDFGIATICSPTDILDERCGEQRYQPLCADH